MSIRDPRLDNRKSDKNWQSIASVKELDHASKCEKNAGDKWKVAERIIANQWTTLKNQTGTGRNEPKSADGDYRHVHKKTP